MNTLATIIKGLRVLAQSNGRPRWLHDGTHILYGAGLAAIAWFVGGLFTPFGDWRLMALPAALALTVEGAQKLTGSHAGLLFSVSDTLTWLIVPVSWWVTLHTSAVLGLTALTAQFLLYLYLLGRQGHWRLGDWKYTP